MYLSLPKNQTALLLFIILMAVTTYNVNAADSVTLRWTLIGYDTESDNNATLLNGAGSSAGTWTVESRYDNNFVTRRVWDADDETWQCVRLGTDSYRPYKGFGLRLTNANIPNKAVIESVKVTGAFHIPEIKDDDTDPALRWVLEVNGNTSEESCQFLCDDQASTNERTWYNHTATVNLTGNNIFLKCNYAYQCRCFLIHGIEITYHEEEGGESTATDVTWGPNVEGADGEVVITNKGNVPLSDNDSATADNSLQDETFTDPATGASIAFSTLDRVNYPAVYADGTIHLEANNQISLRSQNGWYICSVEVQSDSNNPFLALSSNVDDSISGNIAYMPERTQSVDFATAAMRIRVLAGSAQPVTKLSSIKINVDVLGSATAPLSVAEAGSGIIEDGQQVEIRGTVIGCITSAITRDEIVYGHVGDQHAYSSDNIILSDRRDGGLVQEGHPQELVAVQITPGSASLSLAANPGILGHEVRVHGTLGGYLDGPGLLNADNFVVYSKSPVTSSPEISSASNSYEWHYDIMGRKISATAPGLHIIRAYNGTVSKKVIKAPKL